MSNEPGVRSGRHDQRKTMYATAEEESKMTKRITKKISRNQPKPGSQLVSQENSPEKRPVSASLGLFWMSFFMR